MAKLSIKVVVAGRNYPLTIDESEKESVERAAEDISFLETIMPLKMFRIC